MARGNGVLGGCAIRIGKHNAEPRTPWKGYLTPSCPDGNVTRAIDIHEGDKVDEAALNPSADGSSALPWRSISRARASHATGRYVASRSPGERCLKSALMAEANLVKTDERPVAEVLATIDKPNACGGWGEAILPSVCGLLHL
jgi:hypothetical protein